MDPKLKQTLRSLDARGAIVVVLAVFAIVLVRASVYSVKPESVAVVTRFGKYVKTTNPGLRFLIPFVDRYQIVQNKRQQKQEFGFGTPGNQNPTQWSSSNEFPMEKTMVTGDLNSVEVEWIVQYRIDKPSDFLFNVRDPELTLRDVSESVMREVVGDRTVDEVLTIGRQEIETVALAGMQAVANSYAMGLHIDQVQLKNINPPRQVRASFDEVNEAQQEREQLINVANGEYNKVIPRAKGEADQAIQQAEGYALQRVNEAQGDVERFLAMLNEYRNAPAVTRQRIYLETMAVVLPRVGRKFILDGESAQVLPLLPLQDLMKGGAR